MKIMVVDDERDIELLFRQKFKKEIKEGKLQFIFAFSAEEALEYMDKNPNTDIVLILSDINMPGISGIELLKILKCKYSHIKIFMITAYGDERNYCICMEYGADKFITKPIDFNDLKDMIISM
jgi:CheY-like chemotaxis protein